MIRVSGAHLTPAPCSPKCVSKPCPAHRVDKGLTLQPSRPTTSALLARPPASSTQQLPVHHAAEGGTHPRGPAAPPSPPTDTNRALPPRERQQGFRTALYSPTPRDQGSYPQRSGVRALGSQRLGQGPAVRPDRRGLEGASDRCVGRGWRRRGLCQRLSTCGPVTPPELRRVLNRQEPVTSPDAHHLPSPTGHGHRHSAWEQRVCQDPRRTSRRCPARTGEHSSSPIGWTPGPGPPVLAGQPLPSPGADTLPLVMPQGALTAQGRASEKGDSGGPCDALLHPQPRGHTAWGGVRTPSAALPPPQTQSQQPQVPREGDPLPRPGHVLAVSSFLLGGSVCRGWPLSGSRH